MKIKFFTTGGTIDKLYFDALDRYQVGEPQAIEFLEEANVTFEYEVTSILRKDSLELTDDDRQLIVAAVAADPHERILVTHGTDTMIATARALQAVQGKTIVLVGAMRPARFRATDAEFNIGFAVAAVQILPPGVYVAMNGRVFDPQRVRKNREKNRFEPVE
jgi:L-asparaginase